MYDTSVTAVGGREGSIRSDDGLLDLSLALPKPLGGPGGATNPEQLFAGGYAACFCNAALRVGRKMGHTLADDAVQVTATIGLKANSTGGFVLTAALAVSFAGIDQAMAEAVVAAAHQVCPYSNAIRGNVDVAFTVTTR